LLVSIAHLSPSAAYHIIIDQLIFSALASIVGNQLACIIVTNHQQKAAELFSIVGQLIIDNCSA
jgi:hypothetical protein